MPKLAAADQFIDLSDYGRPPARWLAKRLRHTPCTPVHLTFSFLVIGLLAIACLLQGRLIAAGLLLVLKSVLDAADGELARAKQTPSYTGRYLDSAADTVINFALILALRHVTGASLLLALSAFLAIQLQCTLYNYYYVIVRSCANGADKTSRVIERGAPTALPGESQDAVNSLHRLHVLLYGGFDRLIYLADPEAVHVRHIPKWFMTMVSVYGLGFQLLLVAVFLALDMTRIILPFFIIYSLLIPLFVAMRKVAVKPGCGSAATGVDRGE